MTVRELYDFLRNNPEGTKFPGDLVIRGNLDLVGEDIVWLPEGIIVTGDMCILHCPNLKFLPANLFVGGNLIMTFSHIKSIPADLRVGGEIWADGLDLDIPAGFTTHGGLHLNGAPVLPNVYQPPLRLPENLTINGVLDVTDRNVEKWPKNLFIKGRLVLGYLGRSTQKLAGIIVISGSFTINGTDLGYI